MHIERFSVEGKKAVLYQAEETGRPLIILHEFEGDGKPVVDAVRQVEDVDFNLLCIGNLQWNHDMSPWNCPPAFRQDEPCTGGADEYLPLLQDGIIPRAMEKISGTPSFIGIAGYSLAGLFALYALYQTDIFSRAACMSGSFWFPDFKEYVLTHTMRRPPERLYFSLGDKEAKTRNPVLKTVREHTEAIVEHYRRAGLDVTWEINPGNHFRDAGLRSAKGILAIL